MQQAALKQQSSLWGQELLLTKQALTDVTAAKQKTTQVQEHRVTLATLQAVRSALLCSALCATIPY